MRRTEKFMKDWLFTYKDGEKTTLDLPHTWNALEGQDGGDDYFKGTCTYEKMVKKPEFSLGERVYLQFHGVNASAKVVFNGETVCVRDGGIYRDVEFLIVSEEHFDLDYFGGPGMKYDTDVNGKDAKVNVTTYNERVYTYRTKKLGTELF